VVQIEHGEFTRPEIVPRGRRAAPIDRLPGPAQEDPAGGLRPHQAAIRAVAPADDLVAATRELQRELDHRTAELRRAARP
jgi:hypothetical protein